MYVLILCVYIVHVGTCLENFGPYTANVQKAETCKEPKKMECGHIDFYQKANSSEFHYTLNVTKSCNLEQIKIQFYNVTTKTKYKMFNYVFNKPCQHFVLGPLVQQIFKVDGADCKVAKGTYKFMLDSDKMCDRFFGSNFFYGTYEIKSSVIDTNCNLFCMKVVSAFIKKVV